MSAVTAPRRQPARPAPSPARRRRHLRVVEDVPRRHPIVFLLLYLVTGIAIVLGAVSLNALAAGGAVDAAELSRQVSDAQRHYELMVAQVAQLENPERIRAQAEQMGMIQAQNPRYLEPGRELPADTPPAATEDPVKPLLQAAR